MTVSKQPLDIAQGTWGWLLLRQGAFPRISKKRANLIPQTSPYSQKSVPSHGHVRSQLLHLVSFLDGMSPSSLHRRGNEGPLPGLLQLVAVLVEVVVHLALRREGDIKAPRRVAGALQRG